MTRREIDVLVDLIEELSKNVRRVKAELGRLRRDLPDTRVSASCERIVVAALTDGCFRVCTAMGSTVLPPSQGQLLLALAVKWRNQQDGLVPFKRLEKIREALGQYNSENKKRPLEPGALRTRVQRLRRTLRGLGLDALVENDGKAGYRIAIRAGALEFRPLG